MVKMRDDKNVMKITNSRKISVLLKIVRIIKTSCMNRTCGYNQGFLKVGEIVRI